MNDGALSRMCTRSETSFSVRLLTIKLNKHTDIASFIAGFTGKVPFVELETLDTDVWVEIGPRLRCHWVEDNVWTLELLAHSIESVDHL